MQEKKRALETKNEVLQRKEHDRAYKSQKEPYRVEMYEKNRIERVRPNREPLHES